jgi:PucR C-terminal helix-turn-helix domain/GGDEF-like domain
MQNGVGSAESARAGALGGLCARRAELAGVAGALREQASALDRVVEAITREHADELARVGGIPERRRVQRVRRLLDGGTVERAELDYEFEGWHLGVIATGVEAEQAVRELAAGVDRRLLSVAPARESVWAWLGGRERLVAGALERAITGTDAMGSHSPAPAPTGVVLALGEPARGLEGWRLTHRQAQAALTVALRRPRRLTRYADVALLTAALEDQALARALREIYLLPLDGAHNRGPVLRQTLRAYLTAGGSVSSAAVALGVARKTIETRLRTIEERLGRTLHPCPAELTTALLLDELTPTPATTHDPTPQANPT